MNRKGLPPRHRRCSIRILQGREVRPERTGRRFRGYGREIRFWVKAYPIVSIEDGLAEDDWEGWVLLTKNSGQQDTDHRRRLVRHEKGPGRERHYRGGGELVLVKVNQVGSITDSGDHGDCREGSLQVLGLSSFGRPRIFVADLSVATNSGQLKPALLPE